MRLFGIESDGTFIEFRKTPFGNNHQEEVMEDWLELNPEGIVEDGRLLIIGRQVTTNLNTFIDLLALDREGNVVIIELKRERTPRDTLAQALEYASFAEVLDAEQLQDILRLYLHDETANLSEYHREYFNIAPDETVTVNKDQRIVIVGQTITNEVRQTSSFLRKKGLRVTCIEFSFFQTEGGGRLLSHDIVVGKEPSKIGRISSGSLPIVKKDGFLDSLDQYGRPVFQHILQLAKSKSLPIHWGTKGFSLNHNFDGKHVALSYVYPPHAIFKQSIYTAFAGQGGLMSKVAIPDDIFNNLFAEARNTGLFVPAGGELKCLVNRIFTENEISALLKWLETLDEVIAKYGLRE